MTGQWQIIAEIEGAAAAIEVAGVLEERAGAGAAFEVIAETATWCAEASPRAPVLQPEIEIRLALAAAGAGGRLKAVSEQQLPERDWLSENRRAFPPLRIGRFFVHGSHWLGRATPGALDIEIDAATAFGTGEHPTTRGCLLALDRLALRRSFRTPLDIG